MQLDDPPIASTSSSTTNDLEPILVPTTSSNADYNDSILCCSDCGRQRPLEITYTIEDLDVLERQQQLLLNSAGTSTATNFTRIGPQCRPGYRSFLSPDDALRDLRRHASQGAEIRWELQTSRTDVNLPGDNKRCCGCRKRRPSSQDELDRRATERPDLRKHHSAEIDKWSLRQDNEHELRKHLSDDGAGSRMDGGGNRRLLLERKWTLQVPEVHENPRRRCTCPKSPRAVSPSPEASSDASSRSLSGSRSGGAGVLGSSDDEIAQIRRSISPIDQQQQAPSIVKQQPTKRTLRRRWAEKAHQSLPAVEKRETKWIKAFEDGKSKSLKERPKYSVRRSLSPDPDPRQVLRLESRLVRRYISPEITLKNAKWAPYEGHSPLPNVGVRGRRDVKKIADIKWQPYEETSPKQELLEPDSPPKDDDEFRNITPTHLPPPLADGVKNSTSEEQFRMRFLNQVSAFPIYQGAWREETPPPSPKPEPPIWSPQKPRQQASIQQPTPSPSPPPRKSSTFKIRSGRKKSSRAKSQEQQQQPLVVTTTIRASSQEGQRRRPQLQRSTAFNLLDITHPHIDPSKRSLSEEVTGIHRRSESTKHTQMMMMRTMRAKSEDASRYMSVWDPNKDEGNQELREYVTTV